MTQKFAENIGGRFYVDTNCINCSPCAEMAPTVFATNHEEGYEYVKKQPDTQAELALTVEAIEICPTNAIQDQGLDQGIY